MASSSLETCPTEVLERIVLALDENQHGPPTDLPSVLRVSKTIYCQLSVKNNPTLYSAIFVTKFDAQPVVHRMGETSRRARHRAEELIKRFVSLKRFKFMPCREFAAFATARDDLWMVYIMFLEHTKHNYGQLIYYAGIDRFASKFMEPEGPFHDGAVRNEGWKVDNEVNALVAWLFWFTDKKRVASETTEDRKRVLAAFAHVFVGSFKYASTHAPITSFFIPPLGPPLAPPPRSALSLAALPPSHPTYLKDYFGQNILFTHPLLTPASLLICAVRLEAAGAEMPIHHLAGYDGATSDELRERRPITMFLDWEQGCGYEQFEHDWNRLLTCYDPWSLPMTRRHVFTPGMLTGFWVGRLFEIPLEQFDSILNPRPLRGVAGSPILQVYPKPMQFHLREYHQHDPTQVIGYNDISRDHKGEGVFTAWLPQGVTQTQDQLHFDSRSLGTNMGASSYDMYDPRELARRALDDEMERTGLYSHGVYDIILTARTDERIGEAWSYMEYYGRVRDWDGLVLLVRVETQYQPSLVFSGYVHANQNLVGRWRDTNTPVDRPGWEGVWSMSKIA